MKIYIIELIGKDAITLDTIIQRHANAFTSREAAEAEKDAFKNAVFNKVFDQRYKVHVAIIEMEVVQQTVWVVLEGAPYEGQVVEAVRRTREEAVQFVEAAIAETGGKWDRPNNNVWQNGVYRYRLQEHQL